MIEGIVTKGIGGTYTVRRLDDSSKVLCQIRGGIRKKRIVPAVGDFVNISDSGDPDIPYIIESIKERKNSLVRPPVANIDYIVLTFAVVNPEPDLKLLDKMLIICFSLSITPVIVFTKADLNQESANRLYSIYSDAGYKCFISSKDQPLARKDVASFVDNSVAGFAGPSGVGKSTICNHLLEEDSMQVGDISERLKRGKHTTRHVELFDFENGYILDTPGFTSLDLFELGITYEDVIYGYPEMIKLSCDCKFDDCRHLNEKECAVTIAVGSEVDEGRYARYKEFYDELYAKRNDYSGRRKL